MYGFVLGPLPFQSTGENTHLTSETVILAKLASNQNNSTKLHSNWAHFQKAQLTPYKTMYDFPTHFRPQAYFLWLPLE